MKSMTSTAPVVVQVQLAEHGDRAVEVAEWLEDFFGHLRYRVAAAPGLSVTLTMPDELGEIDGHDTWAARLLATSQVRDVAWEILATCFEDLGLAPCTIISSHLTHR